MNKNKKETIKAAIKNKNNVAQSHEKQLCLLIYFITTVKSLKKSHLKICICI